MREELIMAAEGIAATVGIAPACRALGVARSSLYRHRQPAPEAAVQARRSYRALTDSERRNVLSVLIRVPHLASHVLGLAVRRLRRDWYVVMVAFHRAISSNDTGSTVIGRNRDNGQLISVTGIGETFRLYNDGTMLCLFGGRTISPTFSILSNSNLHPATFTCPFGAFQGKFSHTVADRKSVV